MSVEHAETENSETEARMSGSTDPQRALAEAAREYSEAAMRLVTAREYLRDVESDVRHYTSSVVDAEAKLASAGERLRKACSVAFETCVVTPSGSGDAP